MSSAVTPEPCPVCGQRAASSGVCASCGARPGPTTDAHTSGLAARITCERCGRLTVPAPYFSRSANVAKLVVLAPLTSLVGSLGFFLLRKDRFICRYCNAALPIRTRGVSVLDAFSESTSVYLVGGSEDSPLVLDERMVALDEEAGRLEQRRAVRRRWAGGAGLLAVGGWAAGVAEPQYPLALWGSASLVFALLATLFLVQASGLAQAAAELQANLRTLAIRKLAGEHDDRLDVATVSSALSVGEAEAERLLDAMVLRDEAELQVDDEGRLTYWLGLRGRSDRHRT